MIRSSGSLHEKFLLCLTIQIRVVPFILTTCCSTDRETFEREGQALLAAACHICKFYSILRAELCPRFHRGRKMDEIQGLGFSKSHRSCCCLWALLTAACSRNRCGSGHHRSCWCCQWKGSRPGRSKHTQIRTVPQKHSLETNPGSD